MLGIPLLVQALTPALVLGLVYFVLRVRELSGKLAARDARVEKLRCDLACSDASAMRLTDKISQLETVIQNQAEGKVVAMFPEKRSATP